jgi:membrane associated rhomboid family serine protease/pSer/pThr/pTyr-binding forkhead associated (FHA) protein
MLQLSCLCGETVELPESFVGETADCPACGKPLIIPATPATATIASLAARLSIAKGPDRIGEQYFFSADTPIDIGKLPGSQVTLVGTMVSRRHCRLTPVAAGWKVEDLKSTNGLFVNGARVQDAELHGGDLVRVGEYELRFDSLTDQPSAGDQEAASDDFEGYELAGMDLAAVESTGRIVPDQPVTPNVPKAFSPEPLRAKGSGPECPCCAVVLAPKAKICVTCGIKVPSGRPLATSRGVDENFLFERTHTWLQLVSFVLRIGLLPVASEAFGTKKARGVWAIFAITFVCSAIFLIVNWGERDSVQYGNLMLWTGSNAGHQREVESVRRELDKMMHKSPSKKSVGQRNKPADSEGVDSLTQQEIRELSQEFERAAAAPPKGEFHVYQLLTHALLHGGILHFAGNMVFLLVFGLRVNELIGDLKFSIVYPLLAIASALSYMASTAGQSLHPMLGASGAIMGLAGMYFVFFPVQRVHMAFWLRLGWVTGLYLKMFRMRGFWLLVMWISFNDLLPMALAGGRDPVAHWAHLGGFLSGMAVAIILLASRLVNGRGADLLSFAIGKYAWPLLGKPNTLLEAPTASAARQRLVLSHPF